PKGARVYMSGDLARFFPDSFIDFLGRIDNQVKLRGFRIELQEIEAALRQFHSVNDAAVIVHSHASSSKRLVAFVVSDSPPDSVIPSLLPFLAARLPDFMIPSAFEFLDSLPLPPAGKLDRLALNRLDLSPLPSSHLAYHSLFEELLAHIWSAVLQTDL